MLLHTPIFPLKNLYILRNLTRACYRDSFLQCKQRLKSALNLSVSSIFLQPLQHLQTGFSICLFLSFTVQHLGLLRCFLTTLWGKEKSVSWKDLAMLWQHNESCLILVCLYQSAERRLPSLIASENIGAAGLEGSFQVYLSWPFLITKRQQTPWVL